jgi:hypothetical protein
MRLGNAECFFLGGGGAGRPAPALAAATVARAGRGSGKAAGNALLAGRHFPRGTARRRTGTTRVASQEKGSKALTKCTRWW